MSQARTGTTSGGEAAPAASSGVAVLEQALWRDLTDSPDDKAFCEAWLGLCSRMIPGVIGGVVLLARGERELIPAGAWPTGHVPPADLLAAARSAAEARRGAAQPPGVGGGPVRLAWPILLDSRLGGAVALELAPNRESDLRSAMRHLRWAVGWVIGHLRRRDATFALARAERGELALDLLAAALDEDSFIAACRTAATELADRLDCERVSIGFSRNARCHVAAISHTAQYGKRMNLVRQLGDAMDEAIDQRRVLLYPAGADDEALSLRAHAELAGGHRSAGILTVPMLVNDHFIGAVTFERSAAAPLDQPVIDLAEAVVAILGPALLDKKLNDRWLVQKISDSAWRQALTVLGPGWPARKLVLALTAALFAAGWFATGPYLVVASGRIEGSLQHAIAAPFDGFVSSAPLKAGNIVQAGAVIATLDDRDLVLERLRWVTERQQHVASYDKALGDRQRAETQRAQNLVDQADAQIRLVDAQLQRARITVPFDGLVISGDLTQSIGGPVRRGDLLFELAPLNDYRVELRVHESQIADIGPGATGHLLVAALPDTTFPFTVDRITPIAVAFEGRMYFKVEGHLNSGSDRLRPGMEGVGKISAGEGRLVWIWSRSLLYWTRLAAWKWLP